MASSSAQTTPPKPEFDRARKKQLSVLKLSQTDLVKAMDAVTKEQVSDLVKQSVEIDVAMFDMNIFSIFEFQGFDPYAVMRKLIMLKQHYKLSDEDLKVDILYMIAANIYMGNLSGKALARRGTEGRTMIDDLQDRYKLELGSTGTGKPSDVLTIPRISAAFPMVSCKMAERLPTKDHIGEAFMSVPVPRFMRVNAFASFCPQEMALRTRLFLLKAAAAYSCDQSIVFSKGQQKKDKKKPDEIKVDPALIAADQWTFIWAASEGPVPPLDARRQLHVIMNTVSLYDRLRPVVVNYDKIVKDTTLIPTKEEYEKDISAFISPATSTTPGSPQEPPTPVTAIPKED